ncbi:hypothetical protein GCM10023115_55120 [Pontixanthobacter gangjinensis]|uniref:Uncharacterized protein n=1 Tax=Pontixanthobacter gangjinensis TaxID=1028742 RepID=A0A6I4STE0_9SPHN|nr:hypothetical protein [Pontixanthobacter gangjinensis]MXO57792.1 hypothetical protein [Pontixanthobacter gangjinensis]
MFGKILGAFIGSKAAQQTRNIGGPAGAAIGVASTILLRRMSLPAMAAVAVGGYAFKKFAEKKNAGNTPSNVEIKVDPAPIPNTV